MKKAFTLAEVLITLGIIGVVASMTMPSLISKYRERVFVERLKQTYSIFSQAYLMAVTDNGEAENWDLGVESTMDGASKVFDIFSPYLNKAEACREKSGCFADSYKTFSGYNYGFAPKEHTKYARGILANGVSFAYSSSGSGCSYVSESIYSGICAVLYVDLNGYKLPNKAGIDYFAFYITKKAILPMGLKGWNGGMNGHTCEFNGTSSGNGTGCTAWVLNMQNMDYLRRDISNDWK